MQHVSQKHPHGCGPACLAMVTGHNYDTVVDRFNTRLKKDFLELGLYETHIEWYLNATGFAQIMFYGSPQRDVDKSYVGGWPLGPFCDAHIAAVTAGTERKKHFVVMDASGMVLDPAWSCPRPGGRLTDYHAVERIWGLVKLSGVPNRL